MRDGANVTAKFLFGQIVLQALPVHRARYKTGGSGFLLLQETVRMPQSMVNIISYGRRLAQRYAFDGSLGK